MTEQSNVLEVNHLAISFESYNAQLEKTTYDAIKDLTIAIKAGEILAIVGSSGSGKSLLAHAIVDILPKNAITSGTMIYKGSPLTKERIHSLRGSEIAFIPQSVSFLDPLMTVGKQVRGVKGTAAKVKQEQLFTHFRLKQSVEKFYPFQLSGGMARRILLSTALIGNAELIVADEPTPGLDLETALKALADFRRLADDGKAIILITHDIDLAMNIADTLSIFHDGRVIETASTSTFRSNGEGLSHPYSRALFAALPQNGFKLEHCPRCNASAATWDITETEMRCRCDS